MTTQTDNDDETSPICHGIDLPSEVVVEDFSKVDNFFVSVDIDSLYFGHENLLNVVRD